jgi:endonuclease-3 related protein
VEKKELVFEITRFIPKGKVATYGQVAQLACLKNPRVVGNFLHQNKDPKKISCHRVVSAAGKLAETFAFGGLKVQAKRLENERVNVVNGKVINLQEFLWQPTRALKLYFQLIKTYGPPGPWPWYGKQKPHTPEEIAIGAILTQNVAWRNVEYSLDNLRKEKVLGVKKIYKLGLKNPTKLKKLIKPAGFYNQKAKRLFGFCQFIVEKYHTLDNFLKNPLALARRQLLDLWGIGEETSDTILLYSGNKPIFVIDAYTKRFVKKYRLTKRQTYHNLQSYFTEKLPQDVSLYQNYHALIIKWGKTKL